MAEAKFPAVTPIFEVADVDQSIEFYKKLGFEVGMQMPGPGGKTVHAGLAYQGAMLMLEQWDETTPKPLGKGVTLYIDVPDANAFHSKVTGWGVTVTDKLEDKFWGRRDFSIQDPDGYRLTLSQHVRDVSPEEMQQAMTAMAH